MAATAPSSDLAVTRAAFRTVFPGVMVAMFLASIDQTILATTLPAIAASFGDLADLSWVAIAYLLAATVTAPIHGHLGDRFGRRRVLLGALAVFVAASVACAFASSLAMLVSMRAVQGAGAGGLMTLSQALIGEHVPARERGRFQGYFAAMYALSSTLGPVMGGILTEHFSWRAVFVINLPLGFLAAFLALGIPQPKQAPTTAFHFDFTGAALFGVSAVALLFALGSGGHRIPWVSGTMLLLLSIAALGFVALAWWERRVNDPVIPVRLLAVPAILRSNVLVSCFAALIFSAVLYLPLYLQLGRGSGIGESGLLLLPISLTIAVGATMTGRLITRTGRLTLFPIAGLSMSSVAFGALAATLPVASTQVVIGLIMLAMFGLGAVMPACQIIVQDTAGRASLGAATASISVCRSIGGATGVAVAGAVIFGIMGHGDVLMRALQGLRGGGAPGIAGSNAELATLRVQLDAAFRSVFLLLCGISTLGAAVACTIPRRRI